MTATDEAVQLIRVAAKAAHDKQAENIVAFDVSQHLAITDAFLVASASSERQVGAVVDAVEEALLTIGRKPVRREGDRENRWVLLDFVDAVIHIQHEEERVLYNLERLWKDCPPIDVELPADNMPSQSMRS